MPFPIEPGADCAPMPTRCNCYLFVGPTLYQSSGLPLAVPADVCLQRPASRGDVAALAASHRPPGVIALVDGLFHQSLAVCHEEIREVLQSGWRVWGLSSMGAIRAYEMRALGMRGFGQVYAMFETQEDFQDDEVALLHESQPPYRPLTEPLIHCRTALAAWVHAGFITDESREAIVTQLKACWYGDRTLALFEKLLWEKTGSDADSRLRTCLVQFDRYRLKTTDLAAFLALTLWRLL